jgi:hypothetical protein
MRKKGENSVKLRGKSAMKDHFTLGAESQHQRQSPPTPW